MFKKIGDQISFPDWVARDPRYRRLDLYDRLLDGTFYDHLKWAFYEETDPNHDTTLVRIDERRPSAQFRLPRMVARWCSRKLFAGRHIPRITHPDKATAAKVTAFAKKIRFWHFMLEAVLRGSVGSAAVTFQLDEEFKSIGLNVWRARDCCPKFDSTGELAELQVQYQVERPAMLAAGFPEASLDNQCQRFWYIRKWTKTENIVYAPVRVQDWNPVDGFVGDMADKQLVPFADRTKAHNYGYVTGHWFQNMSGGTHPDGACTFEDAIPDSIDLDYTLSQVGRGVRYGAAPTLVIKGRLTTPAVRGPTHFIGVEASAKQEGGDSFGDGDAKLLEMRGDGTTAALSLVDKLRNFALEQISANRKDAEKMKGPLSGRAMEYLDEDAHDLVMEMRTSYGEYGALALLRKVAEVGLDLDAADKLGLRWPRLYQPTPQDLAVLLPALVEAVYPQTQAGGGGEGAAPKPLPGLLTLEEATAYIRANMDMDILDADEVADIVADDDLSEETRDDEVPVGDGRTEGDPQRSSESAPPTGQPPPEDGYDPGA